MYFVASNYKRKMGQIFLAFSQYLNFINITFCYIFFVFQISSSGSRIGSKSYGDDIGSGTGQYSTEPWLLHDLSSPIFMRFFDIPSTWIEAESICRKHFGHLVRGKTTTSACLPQLAEIISKICM